MKGTNVGWIAACGAALLLAGCAGGGAGGAAGGARLGADRPYHTGQDICSQAGLALVSAKQLQANAACKGDAACAKLAGDMRDYLVGIAGDGEQLAQAAVRAGFKPKVPESKSACASAAQSK